MYYYPWIIIWIRRSLMMKNFKMCSLRLMSVMLQCSSDHQYSIEYYLYFENNITENRIVFQPKWALTSIWPSCTVRSRAMLCATCFVLDAGNIANSPKFTAPHGQPVQTKLDVLDTRISKVINPFNMYFWWWFKELMHHHHTSTGYWWFNPFNW